MSSSRGSQKGRQLVTARRQETWTVHTWVRTQRIQLGGEGHQACGPWATHRDVGYQLQSYEGGSRRPSRRSLSKTLFILFSKEVVGDLVCPQYREANWSSSNWTTAFF